MKINRRKFLRNITYASFLGAGGCSSFSIAKSSAFANGKINMAFIGIGHRGNTNFSMFHHFKDLVNVVALCDTDMEGKSTQSVLETCPDVPRYTDFRKMFGELGKSIDAVCISTPDFSHFPATMLAMSLGKHVYVEKPLGNRFYEIELMTQAAEKYGVVTQMGNQAHSDGNYYQCRSLVESGFMRDVTRIEAYMCSSRRWHKYNGELKTMPPAEPKPANLDWDVWLSQRADRGYNSAYMEGEWRCFYEYGTGPIGDWGPHIFATSWEHLKLGLPSKIEVLRREKSTNVVFPLSSTIAFTFPERGDRLPECRLVWRDGIDNYPELPENITDRMWKRKSHGAEVYGADGRIFARGSHSSPFQLIAGGDPRDPEIKRIFRNFPKPKYNHYESFLRAIRGEDEVRSPFRIGGPLSQICALGALAVELGEPVLHFDPAAKRFLANGRANAMLSGELPRAGWEEYYRM
ncbi:MAG: Gfo/Idh/MocA family oxidoreductase [Kiritimatiellae bacterium]|nr:Gfo/Idh/MocA family oxidoreductase [Kiritimatiellia bacterium]